MKWRKREEFGSRPSCSQRRAVCTRTVQKPMCQAISTFTYGSSSLAGRDSVESGLAERPSGQNHAHLEASFSVCELSLEKSVVSSFWFEKRSARLIMMLLVGRDSVDGSEEG
jgi:hypothetical protein